MTGEKQGLAEISMKPRLWLVDDEGRTTHVLVPLDEYREWMRLSPGQEAAFPHEVVVRHTECGSLVRAWREYRGLTEADMAGLMGLDVDAYRRLETPEADLGFGMLKRVARALKLSVEHLILDDDD